MNQLLLRGAFAAIGLWVATYFVSGLHFDDASTLLVAGLTLGIMNAVVRPLLIVLTLPLTVLSLGFFLLVINAAMVGLVAWLMHGMRVDSFGSALGTAIIVSIVSWIAGAFARN
jgi:putative membrane protein